MGNLLWEIVSTGLAVPPVPSPPATSGLSLRGNSPTDLIRFTFYDARTGSAKAARHGMFLDRMQKGEAG
jgi:hypothetical protein